MLSMLQKMFLPHDVSKIYEVFNLRSLYYFRGTAEILLKEIGQSFLHSLYPDIIVLTP